MTTAIKRRRGTTTQHSTFTGLEGELTVDTTKDTVVVHDGATAGGFPLLRENLSNNTSVSTLSNTQTLSNKTINLSSNTLTGTTAQFNTALSDGDFATLAGTETLSNKTFSTNPTISSGTANGVAYLNGSKVLTTGSALTFDGSSLGVGGAPTTGYTFDVRGQLASLRSGSTSSAFFDVNNAYGTTRIGTNASGVGYLGAASNIPLAFYQNNTEQMRLTSTGLGIGTSSPGYKLDVVGAISASLGVRLGAGTNLTWGGVYGAGIPTIAGSSGNLLFYPSGSTSGESMRLDSSGNLGLGVTPSAWGGGRGFEIGAAGNGLWSGTGYIDFVQNTAYTSGAYRYVATGTAARFEAEGNVFKWFNAPSGTAGNAISFTQAMTLDSSGNLLVGTTSQINQGLISAAYDGQAKQGIVLKDTNATLLGSYIYFLNDSGVVAGQIQRNGTTTVAYTTSSDYRLKENIQPMQNALDVVAQLNPVRYTWKADGSDGQGFIAHELQAVVPDCVTGEKDAVDAEGKPVYQGIDTSFLVATLCKAIQELKAEVDQLKGN